MIPQPDAYQAVVDTPDPDAPIPLTPALTRMLFEEWAEFGSWHCTTCGSTAFWLDGFHNKHCARCDRRHTHAEYD